MAGEETAPGPVPGDGPWKGSTAELAAALRDLALRLRTETVEKVPRDEPHLASASVAKRRLKERLFRTIRPATRRYDRLAADLASVAADLASRLATVEDRSRNDAERLELQFSRITTGTQAEGAPGGSAVPDAYYWAFEERMRGDAATIRYRLTAYEDLARDLLAALRDQGVEEPRWLDLGCGRGEFCELLRDWGGGSRGSTGRPPRWRPAGNEGSTRPSRTSSRTSRRDRPRPSAVRARSR